MDKLVLDALEIYRLTPRCFLRALRLCAVSSTELAPKPVQRSKKVKSPSRVARTKWNRHDETMARQAIRGCVTLSANELVSKLVPVGDLKTQQSRTSTPRGNPVSAAQSPRSPSSTGPESSCQGPAGSRPELWSPGSDSDISTDTRSSVDGPKASSGGFASDQIVLIDLRTDEDTDDNGGGTIAKAIRLDPACMKDTDMLSKWLQHFDGIKGCVICVIDMPPIQAPEVALWRRLLLGEGDGFAPGAISYGSGSADQDGMDTSQAPRDYQSPFVKLEEATLKEDSQRIGMKFALELQKNGFPYVSLLEGGFPSLVEALFNLRGSVEPVIIQHNVEAWQHYLRFSGRGQVILPMPSGSRSFDDGYSSDGDGETSGQKSNNRPRGKNSAASTSILQFPLKKLKDMDELERAKTAYKVAVSLRHERMAAVLKLKISSMGEKSPDAT